MCSSNHAVVSHICLPPALSRARSIREQCRALRSGYFILVRKRLRGDHIRVVLDNLGCLFKLGGVATVAPPFAVGGEPWGEYDSGRSHCSISLQVVCVPRDIRVCADFLANASEYPDHWHSLLQASFLMLDEEWGRHALSKTSALQATDS